MAPKIKKLNHGRETYAVYYGDDYVLKRPLPNTSEENLKQWLEKQHKTQEAINAIRAVDNPVYNVPKMIFIKDDEYQILEERAQGEPLTRELYRTLSRRQQYEIQTSISSFLVDMNELKPLGAIQTHNIADELKISRLDNFINNKMSKFFNNAEVLYMARICEEIQNFSYQTRTAWSHGDLNSGNVFYDKDTSKLYIIDFAEANYQFIYRDIFAPLQVELGICRPIYENYTKYHNKQLYQMPSIRNDKLREIIKYRIMVVYLRRFIKAADDLRINPTNDKSQKNNNEKHIFMQNLIRCINNTEKMLKSR